jgi:MscS family membrane protein
MLMDNVAIKLSQVYVSDTGKNAHIITIHYFTVMPQEITEFYVLREEININIIALFASMHINFAASQINVVVNNM